MARGLQAYHTGEAALQRVLPARGKASALQILGMLAVDNQTLKTHSGSKIYMQALSNPL